MRRRQWLRKIERRIRRMLIITFIYNEVVTLQSFYEGSWMNYLEESRSYRRYVRWITRDMWDHVEDLQRDADDDGVIQVRNFDGFVSHESSDAFRHFVMAYRPCYNMYYPNIIGRFTSHIDYTHPKSENSIRLFFPPRLAQRLVGFISFHPFALDSFDEADYQCPVITG